MTYSAIPTLVFALCLSTIAAPEHGGIRFSNVIGQPGQSVQLVSHFETHNGTITQATKANAIKGSIRIVRDRDMTWTFLKPMADGTRQAVVGISKIDTLSTIQMNGQEEKTTHSSPLAGKSITMTKSLNQGWDFELDGTVSLAKANADIQELMTYLKRRWYPAREVKIGDSWEFDPVWIRTIVENDLPTTNAMGTMRLKEIRAIDQRRIAIIDVSILSSGSDPKGDAAEKGAALELAGEMTVNLDTMLDESLELKGTVITAKKTAEGLITLTLPMTLKVSKTFVKAER